MEEIPWWVYLIFAFLLITGVKASKRRTLSLSKVFVLPVVLAMWSLYALHQRWHGAWTDAGYWIIFAICGSFAGWMMVRKWKIHVDREHGSLSLPGTWTTLILAMMVFGVRFGFGFYYGTHADISHAVFFFDILVSGFITGMFIGRALNFWHRYQTD